MEISRQTYPDLLPRILLWSVAIVAMALISIFQEYFGITQTVIALGIVLLLALLAMLLMWLKSHRGDRQ
jgi:hypothetical protein